MKRKKIIILLVIILVILILLFLMMQRIEDKNIKVTGNEKYTKEEIINKIFTSDWDRNPFVLYFKTKFQKQKTIPFIDKYDVKITSVNSVKITIYEKTIIGYVTYMGTKMYFDKDGIIVESSKQDVESIPEVRGLSFENIVLNEALPVGDDKVFNYILDTTQNIQKYNIPVEAIVVSENDTMKLKMGNVTVNLGKNKDLNDKIRTLSDMYDKITALSGTLDLTEYKDDGSGYTFKRSE